MRLAHQSHLSPWFLINHIPMIPRFLADLFFHFLTILELSCLVVLAWLGTNLFVLVHSVAQKQYHLPFLAGGRGGGAGGVSVVGTGLHLFSIEKIQNKNIAGPSWVAGWVDPDEF